MDSTFFFVVLIVVAALVFDFINGFHDAANAIATVVVTGTLTPLQAVLMAGAANFVGYFSFGLAVAKMVGKGVIEGQFITLQLLFAALLGAIAWNILTWILGLPTSSSHALIGGLVGSALAAAGSKAILVGGLLKIVSFIVLAPLLGLLSAMIFTTMIFMVFRRANPGKAAKKFRWLQLVSSIFYSVGHGTNDAQKTMAIIALALFAGGVTQSFELRNWIVVACYAAISLGTVAGGWRIVKTMGTQITKIRAMDGFCAETASAIVLLATAHFGIPVSTTHVIAGSIMGVGTVERASKVRWVTARRILWAWVITIPAAGAVAFAAYWFLQLVRTVFF